MRFPGAKSNKATENFVRKESARFTNIKEGELFAPCEVKNFDGHKFVEETAKPGRGAIVDLKGTEKFQASSVSRAEDTLLRVFTIWTRIIGKRCRSKFSAITQQREK